MRMSKALFSSRRSNSSNVEAISHQLLVRAGFVHQMGPGLYSLLPLGMRVMSKIEQILRRHMAELDCHEVSMPVLQTAELWRQSGRYDTIGAELMRLADRRNKQMVLSMTHEEAATELCRSAVNSYRQLPLSIFQIQTKVRDDPRPRAGLIRVREFRMKDAYSFGISANQIDEFYESYIAAYKKIFDECELPVVDVAADVGIMGGSAAHEFMYLSPIGEDTLIFCDGCGYSANRQVAEAKGRTVTSQQSGGLSRVYTPNLETVDELAAALGINARGVAKCMFYAAETTVGGVELVAAVVAGDVDVNETKLANAVGALNLRPATVSELTASGAIPGYAGPIGLHDCRVVIDTEIASDCDTLVGANEKNFHFRGVDMREVEGEVTDLRRVKDGDICVECGHALRSSRGVEVANTFKLGRTYSEKLGAVARDARGNDIAVFMASYGIGVGRLMACIAEQHNDAAGLRWPAAVAPFDVHLMALGSEVRSEADAVYEKLTSDGLDVLYDDRDERPGVKLSDADLIGVPIQAVVSKRSLAAGGIEVRSRRGDFESSVVDRGVAGRKGLWVRPPDK